MEEQERLSFTAFLARAKCLELQIPLEREHELYEALIYFERLAKRVRRDLGNEEPCHIFRLPHQE
jgi:hypothetical protein